MTAEFGASRCSSVCYVASNLSAAMLLCNVTDAHYELEAMSAAEQEKQLGEIEGEAEKHDRVARS